MQMVPKIISKAHKQSKSPAQRARSAEAACVRASHGAYMDQTALGNPEQELGTEIGVRSS